CVRVCRVTPSHQRAIHPEGRFKMTSLYVRPAGLVYGADARLAIDAGAGLPLAGGQVCWTMALVSEDRGSSWTPRKVAALKASRDRDVAGWVTRLSAPRKPVAGLAMNACHIMGIVNTTPDSFSDGGVNADADKAIENARAMAKAGAVLLDVGGESTRPGSDPVDEVEEWRRIEPVIATLVADGLSVSCDTRKAAIMQKVTKAGVAMINDVSALTYDTDAVAAAASSGLPVCLMHAQGDPKTMQQKPEYGNVLLDVYDWLDKRIETVEASGIPRERIIADPGIGFGKTFDHNLELIAGLALFHGLGVPVMLGASRKGFIGSVTGEKVAANRQTGSAAVAMLGAMSGVQFVRVHDVPATRHALSMWRATTAQHQDV
ncbi:MAG: dihydropteroate synthase, partial [Pseudomonadota bacterium]